MAEHEITHITGSATYDVVWEYGEPQVGHTTNVTGHEYHCACGQTFSGSEQAAKHIESENGGIE